MLRYLDIFFFVRIKFSRDSIRQNTQHKISSMHFNGANHVLQRNTSLSAQDLDISTVLKLQSSNKTCQNRFYKNRSYKNIPNLQATFLPSSRICRDALTSFIARENPQICLFCYNQTYNQTTNVWGNPISRGSTAIYFILFF